MSVRDVTVHLGGTNVVEGLTFDVAESEVLGIVGPNGAGKTTLLNGISRLVPLARGEVVFDSTAVHLKRAADLSKLRIARTFQAAEVFNDFRVIDYMLLGRYPTQPKSMLRAAIGLPALQRTERRDARDAAELLERFGLGASSLVPLSDLPYGRRKLVDVLRALLGGPRLVLLDEPTSGSATEDRLVMREVMAYIRERNIAVVVIDHDVKFVLDVCDRLLVINFGRALGIGAPAAVMARPDVQAAYTGLEPEPLRAVAVTGRPLTDDVPAPVKEST